MKRKSSEGAKKPARPRKKPKALEPEVMPREGGISHSELESGDADEENIEIEPSEDDIQSSLPTALKKAGKSYPVETLDSPDLAEKDLAAVSPNDPLRRYLEEVRRYPLLEPEQEFQLAMRLKNDGDLSAAKQLVSANLRLVVKIAFEYRSVYANVLDLIQEGNVGLMKAVSKYDPTKGARLGYYSSWWIRSYILKYLLDNFRLVKVGTTQAQKKLFYHLMREKQRIEAQGMLAAPKLLAERLEVREKDVVEMQQRLSGQGAEMSLDTPIDSEKGDATHVDYLVDQHESADEAMARGQLIRILEDRLPEFQKQLNDKELSILKERILAEEPKTLQEVADTYGLTRERARQIEAKVIVKLREFLREDLGSLGDET